MFASSTRLENLTPEETVFSTQHAKPTHRIKWFIGRLLCPRTLLKERSELQQTKPIKKSRKAKASAPDSLMHSEKRVLVDLTPKLARKLREVSIECGRTESDLMVEALEEAIARKRTTRELRLQ